MRANSSTRSPAAMAVAATSTMSTARSPISTRREKRKPPIQAHADQADVVAATAIIEAQAELVGHRGGAGFGPADHADEAATVQAAAVPVATAPEGGVQAFDLRGQAVGQGELDAAAGRPADIVAATIADQGRGRRDDGAAGRLGIRRRVEAGADQRLAVRDP